MDSKESKDKKEEIKETKKKEEIKETKKTEEVQNKKIVEKFKIDDLIGSVFKDKSKKPEIIQKLRPFFSLKVIPQREIDKVYSAVEKIEPDKIDLIEEYEYEEKKYNSKNKFTTKSKSVGLSNFDLDLSASIWGHKQSFKFDQKEENFNINQESSSRNYCIHSIVVKLFRIVIDFKQIKLARQVIEELEEVKNANATEKKILLEKLVDKFGLYVPLELCIGGRINYSFEANSEEEIQAVHNLLQREIKAKFGLGNILVSASLEGNYDSMNLSSNSSYSLDKVKNLSIKIEGGDYTYKDDFKKWIQSFNMDNLQIIEYKTLSRIYSFIPGLESKLYICLENYEDIVLKEIYNLIENNAEKEKEIFKGSSENKNKWQVGITKEQYKSFIIYRKKIVKRLKIKKPEKKKEEKKKEETKEEEKETKEEEKKEEEKKEEEKKDEKKIVKDVICGEIPDGFIICGWILKSNSNSKSYDVISNWERKKEIQIIGDEYFKFKIDLTVENDIKEDIEIDWILELFCIHTDFLVRFNKKNNVKDFNKHYFINCDCNKQENEECYYNTFYKNENFIKMDSDGLQKRAKKNIFQGDLCPKKPIPAKKPPTNLFG